MTTLPALIAPSPHDLISAAGERASFFEFFTAQASVQLFAKSSSLG
jgi:hypothetical protein